MKVIGFLYLCFVGSTLGDVIRDLFQTDNGVRCGSKYCKPTEYCTEFTSSCKSCEEICNPTHHNRDETKCKEDCQSKC